MIDSFDSELRAKIEQGEQCHTMIDHRRLVASSTSSCLEMPYSNAWEAFVLREHTEKRGSKTGQDYAIATFTTDVQYRILQIHWIFDGMIVNVFSLYKRVDMS